MEYEIRGGGDSLKAWKKVNKKLIVVLILLGILSIGKSHLSKAFSVIWIFSLLIATAYYLSKDESGKIKFLKRGGIIGGIWGLFSSLFLMVVIYIGLAHETGGVWMPSFWLIILLAFPAYLSMKIGQNIIIQVYFHFTAIHYFLISFMFGALIGSIIGFAIEKFKQRSTNHAV